MDLRSLLPAAGDAGGSLLRDSQVPPLAGWAFRSQLCDLHGLCWKLLGFMGQDWGLSTTRQPTHALPWRLASRLRGNHRS